LALFHIESFLKRWYIKQMTQGFWEKLPKPFFVLAPMLDITDSPFRQIVAKCGKPDVFYTWFVSVDGLCSKGKENILKNPNLKISKKERPLVVQLFGKDPEKFEQAAKIFSELGFDGIDINFGCPDKDVLKQGAGAQLILNAKLAGEIIKAAKKGVDSSSRNIPVSVKTRVGFYQKNEMEKWMKNLLKEKPAAICLHARTAKQRYGGEADWKYLARAAEIAKGSGTLIVGNGDVKSYQEGILKAQESGVDGIMIGRAILENPWIFSSKEDLVTKESKLKMLIWHSNLFEKYYLGKKGFGNFRKYIKGYVSDFEGSKELRMKLMEAKNTQEIKNIIFYYKSYFR
jgi:nifR3 family TIM-barrel protein